MSHANGNGHSGGGRKVAVIAHTGKQLGGGLSELRTALHDEGIREPLWVEVEKSRYAPKQVKAALKAGVDLVIVWGGDGMVQQCVTMLAGTDTPMAIMPAGTANLLATNLGIPTDLPKALQIALHGAHTRLDVGRMNGEAFAVMGGAGFDGAMINRVDSAAKERLGRLAYVRSTVKAMSAPTTGTCITIDGTKWFEGDASCVLVGNVGTLIGGLTVFDSASPTDGLLDVGVISAEGRLQWLRLLGRVVGPGSPDRSPLVEATKATKIDVTFDKKMRYEIDGGARDKTKHLKVRIRPRALLVCCPAAQSEAAAEAPLAGDLPLPIP